MNVCSSLGKQFVCPAYCRLINNVIMGKRNPLKITFRHFTMPPASKGKLLTQQTPIVSVDEVQTEVSSPEKVASTLNLSTEFSHEDGKQSDVPNSTNVQSQSKKSSMMISENALLEAIDSEVLLEMSSTYTFSLRQACSAVSSLGQMALSDKLILQKLKNDKRFVSLRNFVLHGSHSQKPHSLLIAMKGFQNLGYDSCCELQKALDGELKWGLRRCPIRSLARVIDTLSGEDYSCFSRPDDEASLMNIAIETLQRRWVEVITGSDFISVFKIVHLLADDAKAKLEDRAVELVPEFTSMEMVKVLVILGIQKRRPTPLMRAIAFHLSKSEAQIPIKDLIELVYALNELTFCEPILMSKLCDSAVEQIASVNNSALISSLITSLGQMRYKHKGIIQALEEWISKNTDTLRTFDCAAFLLASAVLNISAENNTEFYAKAKLLLGKPIENTGEWTSIVHSFAVLNQCSPELLSLVLQPNFIKHLDASSGKVTTPIIKLLNLNAIAKHKLIRGYNGPMIDKSYLTKWTAEAVRPSDELLSRVLTDSLGNFLPNPKYLKTNIKLECGVYVDATCLLNDKWDPVPVDVGNTKKDWTKVAIILLGYPSLCLGIKDPTGNTHLNIKLLQCEGYKVITVPYTEFRAQEKIVKRVQYLEQKIKLISKLKRTEISEPKIAR